MWETCLIDPVADPEWLAFLERSPAAAVFDHPAWLGLLRAQYGYRLEACCVRDGGGSIAAGIPIARIESHLTGRRLVSLPFSDVCSPTFAPDTDPTALVALGEALAEQCRHTGLGLTVHAPVPYAPGAHGQRRFVRHLLPLTEDPAEVERYYSKSSTRNIRKARGKGLRTQCNTDAAALDVFYGLHLQTRRRLGAPTQPKRFIRRFERLFEAGLGFVGTVLDGAQPIAAGVFLTYNGTVTYKYGASDREALDKRPNNMLFAEVIRRGCEEGFRRFDFGRTEIENEGLRAFKSSWGATEVDLPYTYLAELEPPPPGLRDRVVSTTIRRSPTAVGRLAGEALYRHYG